MEYEDDRMPREQWPTVKPTTPYGSLPTFFVDDQEFAQSIAMLRYVGKLGGMYPKDDVDAMFVDEVIDTLGDFSSGMFAGRGESPEKVKAAREKFIAESVPRYWNVLNERVKKYNADGPYVLGSQISIADVCIACSFNGIKQGIMDHIPTDTLDGADRLLTIYKAVMEIPKVVEWYKKHPIPNVTE